MKQAMKDKLDKAALEADTVTDGVLAKIMPSRYTLAYIIGAAAIVAIIWAVVF